MDENELVDFYTKLKPEEDLDRFTIKSKLEFLMEVHINEFMKEYNRCFLYNFLMVSDLEYKSDEEKRMVFLPFFS